MKSFIKIFKQSKLLVIAVAMLASLSACEDPIELDLGKPVEQLVIDAVINQSSDTQYIFVSKSVGYLNNGIPAGYEIDSVGILDTSTFIFYPFKYSGNGKYFFVPPGANTFQFDKDYQLICKDGANTYVSQSRLNSPTTIDSLTYKYEESGSFGGNKGNYVTLWSKDKIGTGDFYWLRLYRNDSIQLQAGDIRVAIDNSVSQGGQGDGDLFIIPIRGNFTSRPWNIGETARVEILSITPEMYFYLNLLTTQLQNTGLFAVPPSNVPSNIICINNPDNKVLGFFCMAGKVDSPKLLIK
ncbi:MAG: DUF4249 family protein [bacterium]|nr:DUF4249 family protein [bacterium]